MDKAEGKNYFEEFDKHLMEDRRPSEYFNALLKENKLFTDVYPFTMLGDLITVDQSPQHHPEGSVWNHTMMVVDNAAERKEKSEDKRAFMWSALLHDLGKTPTTKVRRGKITSYDHDKWGETMSAKFLREFTGDDGFVRKVSKMVRWHMQILFVVKDLPFADIKKMSEETSIDEIALLSLCDRLGRGEMTEEKEREEQRNIEIFLEKCKKYVDKVLISN